MTDKNRTQEKLDRHAANYQSGPAKFQPEVVLVARDETVQCLLDAYASDQLTYSELEDAFLERGWSTRSLYEVARSLKP